MRTLLVALLVSTPPIVANAAPSPYDQGRIRLGLGFGTGTVDNDRVFVAGGSLGVFVIDGLEVGLMVDHWFGASPTITRVSPQARYLIPTPTLVLPYVGLFYRRDFRGGGAPDNDWIGGRGGVVYVVTPQVTIELGVAHERLISECVGTCSQTYPEVMIGVAF